MKNKEYLRTDNEGTEVKFTAVETEAKLKNPKKKELPRNEPENELTGLHTSIVIGIVLKDPTWMKMSQQETILR